MRTGAQQGIPIAFATTNPDARGNVPDEITGTAEPGVTALLRELGLESVILLRSEIALAKMEAQEMARVAALEGVKVGAALALAAVGGLALAAWIILSLGILIGDRFATAAAIVGFVFITTGGVLAVRGFRNLRAQTFRRGVSPGEIEVERVVADQQLHEFKQDINARNYK